MEKVVYTVDDVMNMLAVKYSTACKIMREVRSISDILRVKGIIHKEDWEAYIRAKSKNQIIGG